MPSLDTAAKLSPEPRASSCRSTQCSRGKAGRGRRCLKTVILEVDGTGRPRSRALRRRVLGRNAQRKSWKTHCSAKRGKTARARSWCGVMKARIENARLISDVLTSLDDDDVRTLINAAEPVGVGIGGTTGTARIGETTVFVKHLPLTASKRRIQPPLPVESSFPLSATTGLEALPTESGGNWRRTRQPPDGFRQSSGFLPVLARVAGR